MNPCLDAQGDAVVVPSWNEAEAEFNTPEEAVTGLICSAKTPVWLQHQCEPFPTWDSNINRANGAEAEF